MTSLAFALFDLWIQKISTGLRQGLGPKRGIGMKHFDRRSQEHKKEWTRNAASIPKMLCFSHRIRAENQ
jgi:hypothetical protein